VINEKEFFDVFDEDNDYLKKWDADKKKGMITRINKDGDLV
jgi:hypothetical protein